MYYWVFYDSQGNITMYKSETEPNVPGFTLLSGYDENTASVNVVDAWNNSSLYCVQNGQLVQSPNYQTTQLQKAQQAKIAQLRQGYTQTLASGFNVNIGGTQYTFGWQTDDKANLTALQKAIDQGFLTFPVQYADIHGNPVTIPDQTTLNGLEATATRFFNAQHQQVLNLIAQVQAANTASAVNAIQWTPATY